MFDKAKTFPIFPQILCILVAIWHLSSAELVVNFPSLLTGPDAFYVDFATGEMHVCAQNLAPYEKVWEYVQISVLFQADYCESGSLLSRFNAYWHRSPSPPEIMENFDFEGLQREDWFLTFDDYKLFIEKNKTRCNYFTLWKMNGLQSGKAFALQIQVCMNESGSSSYFEQLGSFLLFYENTFLWKNALIQEIIFSIDEKENTLNVIKKTSIMPQSSFLEAVEIVNVKKITTKGFYLRYYDVNTTIFDFDLRWELKISQEHRPKSVWTQPVQGKMANVPKSTEKSTEKNNLGASEFKIPERTDSGLA